MGAIGTALWASACHMLSTGSIEAQTWGWVFIGVAVVLLVVGAGNLLTRTAPNVVVWWTTAGGIVALVTGIGGLGLALVSKCPTTPPLP